MPIASNAARAIPGPATPLRRHFSLQQSSRTAKPVTLADHLERIEAHGVRLTFARHGPIVTQDDPADQVYRIVSGTVRVCRYMPDGRRYIVDFLLPGDLMG